MLRLSGWLLGKLRRELQSHTGAPNVSAIAITWSQPWGALAAKSAMMTGRSAAANASAAFASATGSGVRAGEGIRHAVDGGRLIVPFHDVADRLALNIGGMNPIDEGAALGFGQGAGRTDDEHRRAIEIGVVDAHRRVQQPDDVMDDGDHRLAARPRIAVRDLHGIFS